MNNKETQDALTRFVEKNNKLNEENRILRQAAKIIFTRTESNPGEVAVKMGKGWQVILTADFQPL